MPSRTNSGQKKGNNNFTEKILIVHSQPQVNQAMKVYNMQQKLVKLVCMGDSLTEAYGISEKDGWTEITRKELEIQVINSGISGETTAGMLARFQNTGIAHKPSHMIIMGGTNDIDFDLPINLVISNIKSMTRQARDVGIQYIIAIPPTFYPTGENILLTYQLQEKDFKNKLEKFASILLEFAIADEQPYLDFSQSLKVEDYLDDGIHPNEKGHAKMADQVIKLLRH